MTTTNDAAAPFRDDLIDDVCEPVSAPETRARRPAAPAGRSNPRALPRPAVRDSGVGALVRSIDRQTEALERSRRAETARAPAGEIRNRLHAIRQRTVAQHRELVARRDSDMARRRHDPLNDVAIRNANNGIDRANDAMMRNLRRENMELRAGLRRPPGPSSNRGGRPQHRSQAFQEFRNGVLNYLRHGDETFGGVHLRELQRRAFQERTLTTQIGADGGYLVHPEQDTGPIERLLSQISPMREMATVRSISAAEFVRPFNTGGTSAKWAGETEDRAETDTPKIVELRYPAMELYAEPFASQSMLEDSLLDIEAWLADECGISFAEAESAAYVYGDGVNKPRGILGYDKVADASWAWGKVGYVATGIDGGFGTPSSTVSPSDKLISVVYTLKQALRQSASWGMNRTTISQVRQFKDTQGRHIWQEMERDGEPATLHGYSVNEMEDMPDVGSGAFPIAFGDFKRGYLIVDRLGMTVLRDPYSKKPYVSFYTRKRVGGGIQNFEAIKLVRTYTS